MRAGDLPDSAPGSRRRPSSWSARSPFRGSFAAPGLKGTSESSISGLVIRSAQPTTQLADWARRYQLKSVLNLRGGGPGDWWYGNEIKSAKESGVTYYDLPLSATRRPTRRELLQLIDLLDRCSYPLADPLQVGR